MLHISKTADVTRKNPPYVRCINPNDTPQIPDNLAIINVDNAMTLHVFMNKP